MNCESGLFKTLRAHSSLPTMKRSRWGGPQFPPSADAADDTNYCNHRATGNHYLVVAASCPSAQVPHSFFGCVFWHWGWAIITISF
ncbi:hypothetical protein J6590_005796 [Homalodisca vitripennis]|nr:hypothetical protein J6590_005796 [Homalodisca vitripennis]